MPPKLTQYLNRTILVSIPSLFGDGQARACKLLARDADGLWLTSEEIFKRLVGDGQQTFLSAGPVFVPFPQIAAVLLATGRPAAALPRADAPAKRKK